MLFSKIKEDSVKENVNRKNVEITSSLKNIIKSKNLLILYISTLLFAICQGVYNALFQFIPKII